MAIAETEMIAMIKTVIYGRQMFGVAMLTWNKCGFWRFAKRKYFHTEQLIE